MPENLHLGRVPHCSDPSQTFVREMDARECVRLRLNFLPVALRSERLSECVAGHEDWLSDLDLNRKSWPAGQLTPYIFSYVRNKGNLNYFPGLTKFIVDTVTVSLSSTVPEVLLLLSVLCKILYYLSLDLACWVAYNTTRKSMALTWSNLHFIVPELAWPIETILIAFMVECLRHSAKYLPSRQKYLSSVTLSK